MLAHAVSADVEDLERGRRSHGPALPQQTPKYTFSHSADV
jgi:hypothetical protein